MVSRFFENLKASGRGTGRYRTHRYRFLHCLWVSTAWPINYFFFKVRASLWYHLYGSKSPGIPKKVAYVFISAEIYSVATKLALSLCSRSFTGICKMIEMQSKLFTVYCKQQ